MCRMIKDKVPRWSASLFSVLFISIGTVCSSDFGYPEQWGYISNATLGESNCPNISGVYEAAGEEYSEVIERDSHQIKHTVSSSSSVFWHPDVENEMHILPLTSDDKLSSEVFKITQSDNDYSVMRLNYKKPEEIELRYFDRLKGDYQCKNNSIILRNGNYDGYSDGGGYKIEKKVMLRMLSNGDLLLHENIMSERRVFFVFSRTGTYTAYIRYTRK